MGLATNVGSVIVTPKQLSGCPVLAPNEYKNRHDRVGQYLHWMICK